MLILYCTANNNSSVVQSGRGSVPSEQDDGISSLPSYQHTVLRNCSLAFNDNSMLCVALEFFFLVSLFFFYSKPGILDAHLYSKHHSFTLPSNLIHMSITSLQSVLLPFTPKLCIITLRGSHVFFTPTLAQVMDLHQLYQSLPLSLLHKHFDHGTSYIPCLLQE